MSTLTLRIQTNKGLRRITVAPQGATVATLKQAIAAETGISAQEQKISLDRTFSQFITNNHALLTALNLAQGTTIYLQNPIDSFQTATTVDVSSLTTTSTFKLSPLCQHNEQGRCLYCDPARKNGRVAETERPKCQHGKGVTCVNCSSLILADDAHKKMIQQAKIMGQVEPNTPQSGAMATPELDSELPCNHALTSFCPKCLSKNLPTKTTTTSTSSSEPQSPDRLVAVDSATGLTKTKVNFIPFKKFLADSKPQCLTRHPPVQSCPLCLPPPFPSYAFQLNCSAHKPYPYGQCTKCVPANITLRLQKYRHVDGITISSLASKHMYKAWTRDNRREVQRCWILFGRVVDETSIEEDPYARRAVVSAIYEPPQQQQFADYVEFDIDSPSVHNAIQFANKFHSRPIGIFLMTNELPRDVQKYGGKALIQSKHLQQSAKLQWKFSKVIKVGSNKAVIDDNDKESYRLSEFVTVVLEQSDNIEPQAYMLSDQAMCMARDGALVPAKDDAYMLEAPTRIKYPVPSIIYHDDELEPGLPYLPDNLLVKVRTMTGNEQNYLFCHYDFPSNATEPKWVKGFLSAHINEPWHQRLSDFNLLLALQLYLPEDLLNQIIQHILTKTPFDEDFQSLVSAALIEHELM